MYIVHLNQNTNMVGKVSHVIKKSQMTDMLTNGTIRKKMKKVILQFALVQLNFVKCIAMEIVYLGIGIILTS